MLLWVYSNGFPTFPIIERLLIKIKARCLYLLKTKVHPLDKLAIRLPVEIYLSEEQKKNIEMFWQFNENGYFFEGGCNILSLHYSLAPLEIQIDGFPNAN